MANYYDILNNSSPVLEQNLYQDRNMKGAFKASFDYSVATNFTAYGRNKLADALGLNDELIPKERIKEEFGLDVDQDLSRPQINHRIKLNELEEQMGKSIQASGKITGTVNTVLGALAGAFVDPTALLATWGTASVVGGALKGLKAYKLANIMRSGSFAQKYGARLGTYGAADAGVNIKIGQGIAHNQGEDYGYLDYFVDGAFGAIFGAAFPINLPKLDIPDAILPPKVPTPKQIGTGRPKDQKSIPYDKKKLLATDTHGETKLAGYDEEIVVENLITGEVTKTTRNSYTGGTIITHRKGSIVVKEGSNAEKIANELGDEFDAFNRYLNDPDMETLITNELVENPKTGIKKLNQKKKIFNDRMLSLSTVSDDFFELNRDLLDSKKSMKMLDDNDELVDVHIGKNKEIVMTKDKPKPSPDAEGTVSDHEFFEFIDSVGSDERRVEILKQLEKDGKITKDYRDIYFETREELTPNDMAQELLQRRKTVKPGKGAKVNVFNAADEFIIDGKANLDDVIEFFASNPASNKEKLAILNELKLRKAIPPHFYDFGLEILDFQEGGAKKALDIINEVVDDTGDALKAKDDLKTVVLDMAEQRRKIQAKKNKDKK